ncbi:MAG: hypothetical protein GXP42_01295 [Chloroflexi bacterium]|nr:hypothetical protein [Chloroflexota bacterium]
MIPKARLFRNALLALVLLFLTRAHGVDATGPNAFVHREYIRNGGFDMKQDDWGYNEFSEVQSVGAASDPVLVIKTFLSRGPANVWQEIYLPTRTDAARLSFDYRMVPGYYAQYGGQLLAGFLKFEGGQWVEITSWQVTSVVTSETGWRQFQRTLTHNEVAALQAARQAGQRVLFLIQLRQNEQDAFQAYVDNVSLKLDGEMVYPPLTGRLAFGRITEQGRNSIVTMNPDGSDVRTIWTAPNDSSKLFGLAFSPDGSEIAFASTHEFTYSPFQADIFSVRVSDGRVRRLTNPPGHQEIQQGAYGKGSVTGRIRNNFGPVTTFMVYIQGADQPLASVNPGALGDAVSFTAPNVTDLGPNVGQYIVFIWSGQVDSNGDGVPDKTCSPGLSRANALVDVRAGRTVDVGELVFNGDVACLQYEAASPAWRPDGGKVGFSIDGVPATVDMSGELGTPFTTDATGLYQFAWSPKNDGTILYAAYQGLYQTSEGGGRGALIVSGGEPPYATPEGFDWLPDGSGVVFTDGRNLFLYRFTDAQPQQLTDLNLYEYLELIPFGKPLGSLAVSPDGKYVIFDRRGPGSLGRTLWIMSLDDPTFMWPVTTDHRSRYVDWASAADSASDWKIYLPTIRR